MPVGSIKIISRKFCKPPCCSNLQANSSGSLGSKTSLESNCTLEEINSSLKDSGSNITYNLPSSEELGLGIVTIPSNSYIINKSVIKIVKLDWCFKKYQLNLKLSFIKKLFNMDNLTKELHREASIRVITKCVQNIFNKNIRWSMEMLKWNVEQKHVLEEFLNGTNIIDSYESVKFVNDSVNDLNVNNNIIQDDEINSDDSVLSTINFNDNIIEDNIIIVDTDQSNGESMFKVSRDNEKGVFMLYFIINNIIFKKKSHVWWNLVLNYCECQLKELRLELLRNAKIKIKRGKFQIAMNLIKSNVSFIEIRFKQWALCKLQNVLDIDNEFNICDSKTLEDVFPSGIIANIPFLNQTPFLDLAVKSAIHK